MSSSQRILTVCLGNHCRSPYAEAVLRTQGGSEIEVASAGIGKSHVGIAAHPAMVAIGAQRGYDLSDHRGVFVSVELLGWATSILAMDASILRFLQRVYTPREDQHMGLYLADADVPDPMGGAPEEFRESATVIEEGAARHLEAPKTEVG